MNEEKPKRKRRKEAAAENGGGEKVHKKNWRETSASFDDIRNFLNDNVLLRHNVIMGRPEFRVPPRDEFDVLTTLYYPTGSSPLDEWRSATEWHSVDDRFVNTVMQVIAMVFQKDVKERMVWTVLGSDFVPLYNPFLEYLSSLPPPDTTRNAILELAETVTVKGDVREQAVFYIYLRKWLVGMVAGWLNPDVVNHLFLVFVGEQGIYKTTWFSSLLPPELQPYFNSNASFGSSSPDEILKLSQYGLICCEELDTLTPAQMNRLKWAVTTTTTNVRRSYAHFSERRIHIASYCGTGNNVQFLSDATGTRRWLPFEVERIRSPREHPFDHDAIFAEAYQLYCEGFRYWVEGEEETLLKEHNEAFETPKDELDLVDYYFAKPVGADRGEFMPTAIAQQLVSSPGTRVSTVALGRAFSKLGFEGGTINRCRGYYVVRRNDDERRSRARSLAYENNRAMTQITDDTDVF